MTEKCSIYNWFPIMRLQKSLNILVWKFGVKNGMFCSASASFDPFCWYLSVQRAWLSLQVKKFSLSRNMFMCICIKAGWFLIISTFYQFSPYARFVDQWDFDICMLVNYFYIIVSETYNTITYCIYRMLALNARRRKKIRQNSDTYFQSSFITGTVSVT